jgi:hypothetical protein
VSASKKQGMNSSVTALSVRFDQDNMWVELSDGQTLRVPLALFPRLLRAPANSAKPAASAAEACTGRRLMKTTPSAACWPGMATRRDIPTAVK